MAVDIGLWRSTRGDTHPHVGIEVEWDYWPQATHVVWEAPTLVACVAGAGGGSQQAAFKRHLDPLLAAALARWQDSSMIGSPQRALDRFFREIQISFDRQTEPAWCDDFQATGAAVLVWERGAAIANTGLDRVYRWRNRRLVQLTTDDSLAKRSLPAQSPEWFRNVAAGAFRKANPGRPDLNRHVVQSVEVEPGDLFLVVAGHVETGLTQSYLAGALEQIFEQPVAGAQDIAARLGETVTRSAAASPHGERTEWRIHSRLALAVVWVDEAPR